MRANPDVLPEVGKGGICASTEWVCVERVTPNLWGGEGGGGWFPQERNALANDETVDASAMNTSINITGDRQLGWCSCTILKMGYSGGLTVPRCLQGKSVRMGLRLVAKGMTMGVRHAGLVGSMWMGAEVSGSESGWG